MIITQMRHKRTSLVRHRNAQHQAVTAYASEQIWIITDKLLNRRTQFSANITDMFQELVICDYIPNGITRGHCERVAAISRSMRTSNHTARSLFGCKTSTQWKAAANAFGTGHDIGLNTV